MQWFTSMEDMTHGYRTCKSILQVSVDGERQNSSVFWSDFSLNLEESWRLFLPSNLKLIIGSNLLVVFQVCTLLWISEGFRVTANSSAPRKKTEKDSSGYFKYPPLFTSSAEWAQPEIQKCHVSSPAAPCVTQTLSCKHPLPHLEWGRKK